MTRSELREHIFKMVFGYNFCEEEQIEEQIQLYLDQLSEVSDKDRTYMHDKAKAILMNVEELDRMIGESAVGWTTGRMNKVDLSILRVALYEMKMDEDVPVKVAINEAVELAKTFSSDEAPAFINGVLGKLA